jgi:hypothetical protein
MAARTYRPSRHQLLADLREQSERVSLTRDWSEAPDLLALSREVGNAQPRARSVSFRGVKFPLMTSSTSARKRRYGSSRPTTSRG